MMLNHDISRTKLISAPSVEPIDAANAKLQSRVDHSAEDSLIESFITAARIYCELVTSRALVSQQVQVTFDAFPDDDKAITFPVAPVISIDSVKYFDADGVEQTIDPSAYDVSIADDGRIAPSKGNRWPTTREKLGAVNILATVGYGANTASVPETFKHAIRLLVAHFYENREAVSMNKLEEAPMAVQALLNMYCWRF